MTAETNNQPKPKVKEPQKPLSVAETVTPEFGTYTAGRTAAGAGASPTPLNQTHLNLGVSVFTSLVMRQMAEGAPLEMPTHKTAKGLRQTAVLQMQQNHGNAHVQRLLAHAGRSSGRSQPVTEIENDEGSEHSGAGLPTLAPPPPNGNGAPHRTNGVSSIQRQEEGGDDDKPILADSVTTLLNQDEPVLNQPHDKNSASPPLEQPANSTGTNPEVKAEEAAQNVDQTQLAEKGQSLTSQITPDISPVAAKQEAVEQRAEQITDKIEVSSTLTNDTSNLSPPSRDSASTPVVSDASPSGGASSSTAAQDAADIVTQAAETPSPEIPAIPLEVIVPELIEPVDAAGAPLPVDIGGNALTVNIAEQAQVLRDQGQQFREIAASARADVQNVNNSLGMARQMVGQAGAGLQTASANMEARREIMGKARAALSTSEQKAELVASQAPEVQVKAEEGKAETGPKSSEAQELSSENASKTPDDPEAGGKSQEQGQKLNRVSSDFTTVDNTMGQAKDKAATLAQEAAQATQLNEQTRGKIEQTEAKIGQAETHIQTLQGQNLETRSQVDELSAKPAEMSAQATMLDEEGQALISASLEMETQLQEVEQSYLTEVQTVPSVEEDSSGPEGVIQRAGYEDRTNIDLGSYIPGAITARDEPTHQAREAARQRVEARRRDQLNRINQLGEGNFARATVGERVAMAAQLYGENLFDGVRNLNILQLGGHILQGIVDPRVSLGGVVSGLSMIVSGGANLLSGEQWSRDPIGNALKSTADIVTGITIVLGSISALALVIIGLMTALSFLTLGLAAPITVPVITICTTIAGWTIPATIAVGKWALLLQGITLIVNLIRAAAAPTAEQMLQHSEQAAEDTGNVVNVALLIGGAKLGQRALRGVPATVQRIQNLRFAPRPAPPPTPPTPTATPSPTPSAATGPTSTGTAPTAGPSAAGASSGVPAGATPSSTAQQIANGHAFGKHVVQQGEFPGISTPSQFAATVDNVINNATHVRNLSNGRIAYWHDPSQTVVIHNPAAVDGGTCFRPTQGITYFNNLK